MILMDVFFNFYLKVNVINWWNNYSALILSSQNLLAGSANGTLLKAMRHGCITSNHHRFTHTVINPSEWLLTMHCVQHYYILQNARNVSQSSIFYLFIMDVKHFKLVHLNDNSRYFILNGLFLAPGVDLHKFLIKNQVICFGIYNCS